MNEDSPVAATVPVKQRREQKLARIPVKVVHTGEPLRKPAWIRAKAGNDAGRFGEIKRMLREQKLHTVCEEAACPNIGECFGRRPEHPCNLRSTLARCF